MTATTERIEKLMNVPNISEIKNEFGEQWENYFEFSKIIEKENETRIKGLWVFAERTDDDNLQLLLWTDVPQQSIDRLYVNDWVIKHLSSDIDIIYDYDTNFLTDTGMITGVQDYINELLDEDKIINIYLRK